MTKPDDTKCDCGGFQDGGHLAGCPADTLAKELAEELEKEKPCIHWQDPKKCRICSLSSVKGSI